MKKLYIVADDLKIKLAQQMREYPMGNPKDPNLENVVKNIKDLIRGFNYIANSNKDGTQVEQILQQLKDLGIDINV